MKKLTLNVKKLCKSKNIKMSDLAKKNGYNARIIKPFSKW